MTGRDLQVSFRPDDAVVLAALLVLVLLAWLVLLGGAGTGMDPFAMSAWLVPTALPSQPMTSWSLSYWLIAFFMWAVMMVAMMLPGASPLVLLYAKVVRHAVANGRALHARTAVASFASGYLTTWILFSLLAVSLQWGLERAGAISTMMSLGPTPLSGGLLVAAGLYQLTPLKTACLKHCRGPAAFLAAHWRPGLSGAWRMGLVHGTYCLGCCAVLMLLLFVGGVMNLVWIAALTLFVAIEKFAPFGAIAATVMGTVLIAWGGALILAGL
jgi:predicted metal-binding membrane protein